MLGYLDAAATAPLRPEARDAMVAVLTEGVANPSSVHSAGFRAKRIVDDARHRIAEIFGVRASEIIFTSGGTEANNLATRGIPLASHARRHIVTTMIEHPSVTESCRFLERWHGFDITWLPVDEHGLVDEAELYRSIRADTALVSIGLANAEVGTVQPLPRLAQAVRDAGIPFHTDAVQAAASLPVHMGTGGWPGPHVDVLSLASHKFGGPQGVGALLVRSHVRVEAIMRGGDQERGLRSGTENVAAIAGFAAAVEATADGIGTRAAAMVRSRDALVRRILAEVPGARLTGHPEERLPGHASFVVPPVSGESLLVALDAAGIAASSGSACAAGRDEPSPVLPAMGISPEVAQTAVRFTPPEPLSEDLINRIVRVVTTEVESARRRRRP